MTCSEWIKRNDTAWLIVHDLLEMARDDIRLKVENAPPELVQAINMALYTIRSRPAAPTMPSAHSGSDK